MVKQKDVTQLLLAWSQGEGAALDELLPLVNAELHRLAHQYMRRETPGHTLQTSALVNEAYLKLIDQRQVTWQNRSHFYGIVAQLMRRVLLDHARRRQQAQRGGSFLHVPLDEAVLGAAQRTAELIALDDALNDLAKFDTRKSQIVELRFFGGLSNEEVAEVTGLSLRTIEREWQKAKIWLHQAISNGEASEPAQGACP
jgi:RNA polymerase sigma-70 factor (ECF subfamily)